MAHVQHPPVTSTSRAPNTAGPLVNPSPAITLSSTAPLTTSTLNQPANTAASSPLRDPQQLLGRTAQPNVYEYPHFPPSLQHSAAARHVMNSFGHAMYKTKHAWLTRKLKKMRLSDYAPLVSFTFAMCGIIGATPMPSIIVRGPNKLLPRVERVLDEQHMKNQYAIGVTSGPSFTLFYCAKEDPAFKLQWGSSTVSLGGSEQPLSLCGTRMSAGLDTQTPHSAEATVSCLLEINGEFYALGPAHLFTQKVAAKSPEQLLAELRQMDEDEDEGDDIAFDDDDYNYSDDDGSDDHHTSSNDLISEEETSDSNAAPFSGTHPSPPKVLSDSNTDEGGLENCTVMYPGPKDLQKDSTDCDWAVTLIKETGQQLPNLYVSGRHQTSKFQHVVEIAGESSQNDTQPVTEKSVHILTSSSTKHGTLLLQFANISGLSGRGHCNVYIVSMDNGDDIEMGDSGSLVVDAQTFVAYGHVVATGPRGEAYVVPLHTTICQVKAFFGTANVRLPEPLDLLSRTALHYITTKQYSQAEEAITALTDLVQSICSSHHWERLAHWIRTSKARSSLLDIWDDKLAQVISDKFDNHTARKWLTARHAFLERFRAEHLSVDEYRFTPHPKPFYDFASAVLPQILEELSAPYSTTLRTRRTCQHSRFDLCVISPLLSSGTRDLTSNASIINAIITQVLSALDLTSSSRFTRRSEFRRRFPITGHSTGLQNLTIASSALDIQLGLMVAYSKASLQRVNNISFYERLEFVGPLTKGTLACVYRATFSSEAENGKIELAVKKILKSSTTVVQWRNERRILKQLQTFNNAHIVELLASYRTPDSYALVFPLANSNMDQLMERDLPAHGLEVTAAWVVKQMQGLTKALQYLHTGDDRNRFYGRHGDLKPANILWYPTGGKGTPLSGTLKIADFARSEFRTTSPRRKAICEETPLHSLGDAYGRYTAPECDDPTRVSSDPRASDIWSLGCVISEFFVWGLQGAKERTRLHQSLRSNAPEGGTSFWRLEATTNRPLFSLNPAMKEYLERLAELTEDNAKLRAAVDLLIHGGVLDPNPHERPTAEQLGEQLSSIEIGTLQAQTVTKCPVWTRFWAYTPGYPSRSRHSLDESDYDFKSSSEVPFHPYPDMASDEAFHNTPTLLDAEQVQDMNDEAPLHEYDAVLGYRCDQKLDWKRTCPYCSLEARPVAIKYHARAVHRNRQIHECPDCKELFADMRQLKQHQRQLGLACMSAPTFDGKDLFGREPQSCSRLSRADSVTSLREQHFPDDTSSVRSSTVATEYPTQMRSGGLTQNYHYHDDADGNCVDQ